ncbi:hypothetical protein TR13x_07505 [Caloranaerobacter sp. TR13]|uniref:hypothetical protein n=1 Tax=Caloranaerobacter sp. TR13 TaxID=1302151 RepID=UPI0006D45832|nr:hypothetical protein [Caloranaerobacter sp. TR13]KPU26965.1 hypothetical protein TR13x_07505 [Caloranaerobacter sp. TR13]
MKKKKYTGILILIALELITYFWNGGVKDLESFFMIWAFISGAFLGYVFFGRPNTDLSKGALMSTFIEKMGQSTGSVSGNVKRKLYDNTLYIVFGLFFLLNLAGLIIMTLMKL